MTRLGSLKALRAFRRTPLHRASSPNYSSAQGNTQVGYLLLRIGGEPLVYAKDEQGNTALHVASFSAEDSVAKLLVLYFPGLLQVKNKKGRSVAWNKAIADIIPIIGYAHVKVASDNVAGWVGSAKRT